MYSYLLNHDVKTCFVYNGVSGKYLGKVWLDDSVAWNVRYEKDVKYLSINACLKKLGYIKE